MNIPEEKKLKHQLKIAVITLSDRAFKGEYGDRSGPVIQDILNAFFKEKKYAFFIESLIIPDDAGKLKNSIQHCVTENFDVIITTGGTGIGPRDITIETVQPLIHKEIPGIMELIRIKYGSEKPNALLSRGIAGTINQSIIYTLPGSVKAVKEYMQEIEKTLEHLLYMIRGIDIH